jgi:isopenicillin-N epimerase
MTQNCPGPGPKTHSKSPIDKLIVEREWPVEKRDGLYFNNGSCSVKPQSVIAALEQGWERLNRNPTLMTFLDEDPREDARRLAAELFHVSPDDLLLIQNSTYGLQLIIQSFLMKPGDEFVTTNHEHGCINAICRYLECERGIVVKRANMDALQGSKAFTGSVLDLVGRNTKLVEFSEIDCYSGWRPDIGNLLEELRRIDVPVLVDGAHVPGQGPCAPSNYPMWVASGHKWLGGPNSTGFLYAKPEYAERLKPLCLGDRYYNLTDTAGQTDQGESSILRRLEWQGTADPVRWLGLHAAMKLQFDLDPKIISARQQELVCYLRSSLNELSRSCRFRTREGESESCGMITVYWDRDEVLTEHLRDELWLNARIWTQPDMISAQPGCGMRLSCPVYISQSDIDTLMEALNKLLKQ